MKQPLSGVRVLDFSTLLPGPMATLLLADAGAEVIKIERPAGEDMRGYQPKIGDDSVNFGLLNAGKRSIAIDLKAPGAIDKLKPLIKSADIVIELGGDDRRFGAVAIVADDDFETEISAFNGANAG